MGAVVSILMVSALGVAATVSNMLGAALGLYLPPPKRLLSCILAFAAGSLISALAIELAYQGAEVLHAHGIGVNRIWLLVGGGFSIGATLYYFAALWLERKGAAIRYPTRFREYARERKRKDCADAIQLLAQSGLMRHLPPEDIEQILPCLKNQALAAGEVLFHKGDPGDALYIVASGSVEVRDGEAADGGKLLAELGRGQAVGEMAVLHGGTRTATIRATSPAELLRMDKQDFDDLIARDPELKSAVEKLSHDRAVKNLSAGGANAETWARIANSSVEHLSKKEADQIFAEAADGAGLAIVFGNILDTIPGCLVIGAKFVDFRTLSLTLLVGMFLGGIPEAAASAAMLRKARYTPIRIFVLWSTVVIAGILAAIAGKLLLGGNYSPVSIVAQAVAGGAVLALIAHAMIPEAIEEAGSLVVLPTVAGFLFALYLVLGESFA